MATATILANCEEALTRLQRFDPSILGREDDLGKQLSFVEAIVPAELIIAIYKRISLSTLTDFSDTQLNAILSQANSDYNLFKQILDFSATTSDANNLRNTILSQVKNRRDPLFDQVWQYVAYAVARVTDTSVLETQGRATIQTIKDQADSLTSQLNQSKKDADSALAAIRAVASEQGVSQQAIYFKEEAQSQEDLASKWLKYTYISAFAVGLFAIFSLFLHKFPWLKPDDSIEAFQLISSKVLIFAVLSFLLVMASRNYATHKHNFIVNRHRQNALLTYRAIVEAAGDKGTEDIILAHAASCIFSPQDTGFTTVQSESGSGSKSVLELLTKSSSK